MDNLNKVVIIDGIENECPEIAFDFGEILLQRLIYRMNRLIKPDLFIIICSKEILNDSYIKILKQLTIPFKLFKSLEYIDFPGFETILVPNITTSPFSYLVLENSSKCIKVENLAMDRELKLADNHIHTPLAYCNYNMEIEKTISLAKLFGLNRIRITEHSSHLYYTDEIFTTIDSYIKGIGTAKDEDSRVDLYMDIKDKYSSGFVKFGLEVDCDFNGNFLLKEDDKKKLDFILGSIHRLLDVTETGFLNLLESILKNKIDVLAHPFRIFRKSGVKVPDGVYRATAKLLKKYNTAAEINYHTNEPSVEFIKECLKLGVKFSFGSDSHNLAEIGDFYYHLILLKEAGFNGELKSIMWEP